MDIGNIRQAPVTPAPEQLAQAKKIETKPAAESDSDGAAPVAAAQQKIESKPSDPDGAGRFHAIA